MKKVQDGEVETFLGIVSICSMENVVCVCAASLLGEIVSKETKLSYEKAAHIVGRARDCVHRSLAKVLFAVGGNKLWSHLEFCVSGDLGRGVRCLH